MSKNRSQLKSVARFDAATGTLADYVLSARRPARPEEDAQVDNGAQPAWRGVTPRSVTLTVPNIVQADQYEAPRFVESSLNLDEDGARSLIEQLQGLLAWMHEPYESEAKG